MGNININGKSAVHAKSEGKLITTDTCMTPPFCIPINYTNQAESKMADMTASSVKIQGSPACNNKSNFKISKGDGPGCCGGTSSGTTQQMAEFITYSNDVMIEGKPAVRNGDKMVSNNRNTAPQPLVQPPAEDAQAKTATATAPAIASEFSQSINFSGLIGRDVDTGQLLARLPYESYNEKGEPIPGGSGTLSKDGITKPIFTSQAETIKVVLGGDSAWRKYADALHEGDAAPSGGSANTLNIRFFGLDGDAIKGLECKVCMGSTTKTYTTDDQGLLPAITPEPNATLELSVKKFDGSYKVIDKATVASGSTTLEYVSPKIVVEVKTEKHKGEPGQAEAQAPKSVANDRGDKEPAPKKTKTTPKHISGKTPPKKEEALKPGRNAKGNPQTTYTAKITDWWNSWRMPSMNLWNPMNLVASIISRFAPSAEEAALAKVDDIIEYLEDQADYKYSDTEGTTAILTAMTKGTFGKTHKRDKENKGTSKEQCYKYVKVALVRTQWVKDALVGESASTAGPQLLANGFTDVTDILPDSRWAAPGDITVYKWTAAHLAATRERKGKPNYPNHGHIDVRSYDNYLTDFIPTHFRPNWSHYEVPRVYRLYHDPVPILRMKAFLSCIREYECQAIKNSEERYMQLNCALPDTDSKRFTNFDTHPWDAVPKEKRGSATAAGAYQIVYSTWVELLTGKNKDGVLNLNRKMFSLGDNEKKFTPILQDRMAVALMELRKALGYVRKGEIAKAVEKLNTEWTSLPGGAENAIRRTADKRSMNMGYFEELFDSYLEDEKKKAGAK